MKSYSCPLCGVITQSYVKDGLLIMQNHNCNQNVVVQSPPPPPPLIDAQDIGKDFYTVINEDT